MTTTSPDRSGGKRGRAEDVTLTLECDNRCAFCPRRVLADVRVPPGEVDRVLRRVRRQGTSVVLSGGEAMRLPGFFAVVERCRALGFRRIGLVTNGRSSSRPESAARLLASGVNDVMVSVYSHNPAVHDSMTGRRGSCRESWRGLANLVVLNRRSGGRASVRVNLLVTARNAGTLVATVRRLAAVGVRSVLIMDVLTDREEHLAPYSGVRAAWEAFAREPGFAGMDIRLRGYPPCVFAGAAVRADRRLVLEPMDLDTTVGRKAGALQRYLGGLARRFVKTDPACRRCRSRGRCRGVQRSYLRRFGPLESGR